MATPRKSITQSIGRIQRKRIYENENEKPIIIDIVDNLITIKEQLYKRLPIYNNCGYNIDNYENLGNKIIKISSSHLSSNNNNENQKIKESILMDLINDYEIV